MGIVQLVSLLLPGSPGGVALPPSVNTWIYMQMVEQVVTIGGYHNRQLLLPIWGKAGKSMGSFKVRMLPDVSKLPCGSHSEYQSACCLMFMHFMRFR